MATAREKRIKNMQESMDRLQKSYEESDSKKKPSKKAKAKSKKSQDKAPFSVFGLAGKIKKRKALNRASAKD